MIRFAVALALLAPAQEKFDLKRHPWMAWKQGTTVKWGLSSPDGPRLKQELEISLTSVTDEGFTIAYRVTFGENVSTTEFQDSLPRKDGEETLTLAGKEHRCTIWKSTGLRGEKKSETRFWCAEGIAVPLKTELKIDGKPFSDYTAVATGETVEAAGRKFECVKMTGKMRFPDHEFDITAWASMAVPGLMVKQEFKTVRDGTVHQNTQVVVEIQEGK